MRICELLKSVFLLLFIAALSACHATRMSAAEPEFTNSSTIVKSVKDPKKEIKKTEKPIVSASPVKSSNKLPVEDTRSNRAKSDPQAETITHKTPTDGSPVFRVCNLQKTIGTAFLYKKNMDEREYNFIITASHIFNGVTSTENLYIENTELKIKLKITKYTRLSSDADVSLIFLDNYQPLENILAFSNVGIEISNNTDVIVYGYSSFEPVITDQLIISRGYLITKTPQNILMLYLNLMSKGGSGSPVIVNKRDLIGMVEQRVLVGDAKHYMGVTNAIPVSKIDNLLTSYINAANNKQLLNLSR